MNTQAVNRGDRLTLTFLRTAYHDIPLMLSEIRDYWIPQRFKENDRKA